VTAAFATSVLNAGIPEQVPGSEAHAKLVGTTTSICGRSTLTWFKFWGHRFAGFSGPRCAECLSTLGLIRVGDGPPTVVR
jgi:hypothetical protein